MDGYADLVDDLLAFPSKTKEVVVVEEEELRPETPALDLVIAGGVDALAQQLEGNPSFAINARDPKWGRSLLHEACARGKTEIVKFLLQKTEADLMLRTMLGRCTPLHLAVTNNYRPIVFLLLSHGADASSRDRFACSPMHYVKSLSVAKLLVQYGGKVLDYNTKKKHAAESANAYSESIRKDHRLSAAESDAAMKVNKVLVKYLEQQAEAEYRVKLEKVRQLKKLAKEQAASLAASVPQKKSRHTVD
ncbi:hypothetical protein PR003_g10704 [Phytophthora rubi]|uniref:Uncharacterized protein n=1 Tax=Phytophthora rubi TaxID=129364 RepID=A0A6A4FQB3_9STRA|nr:hypothetical protein PR002_g10585 [Phytophthora rubi]KAE9032895.1 hypothetical protein PR001_g10395 [Phytophthora rubi]KAE9340053.1 hypothetical protein PR003_g10704 [Phytophthora rubi]